MVSVGNGCVESVCSGYAAQCGVHVCGPLDSLDSSLVCSLCQPVWECVALSKLYELAKEASVMRCVLLRAYGIS